MPAVEVPASKHRARSVTVSWIVLCGSQCDILWQLSLGLRLFSAGVWCSPCPWRGWIRQSSERV